MNDNFDDDLYELTSKEGKKNAIGIVKLLLYLGLAALVVITGAHAVMLVLSQTGQYATAGQGAVALILTGIRVAFPLVVELAAIVAGLGFIQSRWRKGQKTYGMAIEIIWLLFAAINMITFFAVERGQALDNWQIAWVQYGLPLSALIAGSLMYMLVRTDPDHAREQERAAASERLAALRFNARQRAMLSPAMTRIEAQRAWMDTVKELRASGYSEAQIRFMMQYTPELLFDGDGNGRADVFDVTGGAEPPLIPLARPISNSTHDAARHNAPATAQPAAGQGGNGPTPKPLGRAGGGNNGTSEPRDF